MSVTIKDIAKIAGVSHSTVSRSLNDHPRISQATKERIKKIAEEVGFEFNSNARGLSMSNKTETIGVIFAKTFEEVVSGLFLNTLMKKVQYKIEKFSYDTIIDFPENRFNQKSNIQRLIDRKKIDGLIIATPYFTHSDYEYIVKNNIPHVFLHNRPQYFNVESLQVFCDHVEGGFKAVDYLIKNGHNKILLVEEEEHNLEFRERTEGYIRAYKANNMKLDKNLFLDCATNFHAGYDLVMENIDLIKEVSAIFFHTDIIALGAIKALHELDYNLPDDLSIIGYDNLELGTYYHPYLTTIEQPIEKLVDSAVEKLLEYIKDKKTSENYQIKIDPILIERESVQKRD